MATIVARRRTQGASKWRLVAKTYGRLPAPYFSEGQDGLSLTFEGEGGSFDAQPAYDVFLTARDIENILLIWNKLKPRAEKLTDPEEIIHELA